jgi:hypothetical protein
MNSDKVLFQMVWAQLNTAYALVEYYAEQVGCKHDKGYENVRKAWMERVKVLREAVYLAEEGEDES